MSNTATVSVPAPLTAVEATLAASLTAAEVSGLRGLNGGGKEYPRRAMLIELVGAELGTDCGDYVDITPLGRRVLAHLGA